MRNDQHASTASPDEPTFASCVARSCGRPSLRRSTGDCYRRFAWARRTDGEASGSAGGADVSITYKLGRYDAEQIVSEAQSAGCRIRAIEFDMSRPPQMEPEEPYTHLYYFATPARLSLASRVNLTRRDFLSCSITTLTAWRELLSGSSVGPFRSRAFGTHRQCSSRIPTHALLNTALQRVAEKRFARAWRVTSSRCASLSSGCHDCRPTRHRPSQGLYLPMESQRFSRR